MEDYIEIVSESGNGEDVDELASSIVEIANNIIGSQPSIDIIDDVYGVLEDLEVLLSCSLTCGEGSKEYLV